jgi:hypothetical protein
MPDNAQKQPQEKIEEILLFVFSLAGLVFMLLYWR